MIPLLAELARAERELSLPSDEEHERALRLLEWPRVAAQIAAHCRCRRAAAALAARRPYVAPAPVALRWRLLDELRGPADRGEWPPLLDLSDALDLLERARPLRLEGPELVAIAAAAAALDELAAWLGRDPAGRPTWAEAAARQERFAGLAGVLRRALDRDGRLLDAASPLLQRLRRAVREREREVRAAADQALAAARAQGLATGDEVVLRGDRYCLPLRAGARRRWDGIVHDRSATGGTLFVEPAAVVELHNELSERRLEMAAEESRILFELNRAVDQAAPALDEAARLLLLADETCAALAWSRRARARRVGLGEGAPLRLCQARHPLLEQALPAAVVPLDLELPPPRRVLLISGPNAGGKSVALKTVGVCALLAQCGWDVPAREDTRLPLCRRFFVDLGDEQSIEMSLSSFQAHLVHLGRFLAGADDRTLVLCDEIGSGTDPEEGAALAFAALEGLAERGATVLASTHYGLLKAAVHDHPAMANAAMDFDLATLRPLYTLRPGVPGASHAFAIAARGGFPAGLLARARERVGEERFQIERLLAELGTRARELAALEAQARAAAEAGAARERELAERLAGLAREREEELAAVRRQGRIFLQEARRSVEAAVRAIRDGGADKASIRQARDELRRLGEGVAEPPRAAPAPRAPLPGERVRIPHLGLSGRVVEARGDRLVAEARGLRLTVDAADVVPLPEDGGDDDADGGWAAGGPPAGGAGRAAGAWGALGGDGGVRAEIDLRGERAEEAWRQLDLLLDRAIPGGPGEILVIHGVGAGRLREYLQERLAADPRVASWAPAPLDRGGAGATIVRLGDG